MEGSSTVTWETNLLLSWCAILTWWNLPSLDLWIEHSIKKHGPKLGKSFSFYIQFYTATSSRWKDEIKTSQNTKQFKNSIKTWFLSNNCAVHVLFVTNDLSHAMFLQFLYSFIIRYRKLLLFSCVYCWTKVIVCSCLLVETFWFYKRTF